MSEQRKQAVSIRLGKGDVRKVKQVAERLGVRDSDVIRFALKVAMSRLAPLCDPEIRGAALVPMFVEAGAELIQHFELDAFRLDAIINEGVDPDRCVAHEDVALLSFSGSQQVYALLRLKAAGEQPSGAGVEVVGGTPSSIEALRQHLYDKYVYSRGGRGRASDARWPDGRGT